MHSSDLLDSPRKLKILMISFACSPRRGGEHLLGWEWARGMADRGHNVLVLTRAKYIPESEGKAVPGLRLIPVPDKNFIFLRSWGEPGRQIFYHIWNRRAEKFAKTLKESFQPDIVHQCTFHTARRPCLPALWGDVPAIWGPVAGFESVPLALVPTMGWSGAVELARMAATWVQIHNPIIRRCLKEASHVVVSNKDTLRVLHKRVPRDYELLPANAVVPQCAPPYELPTTDLAIVAVGLLVPMRPFSLLLKAVAGMQPEQRDRISLTFIGQGPMLPRLQRLTIRLGLKRKVRFLGQISREETLAEMQRAHLLAFLSLRDSGSSSVAEAMTLGLPVLSFNLAGPGAMLSRGGGLIVEARRPAQVLADIRETLARVLEQPSLLAEASQQGRRAAADLFDWDSRLERMEGIYRSAINSHQSSVKRNVSTASVYMSLKHSLAAASCAESCALIEMYFGRAVLW